jgi:hypothetical protein
MDLMPYFMNEFRNTDDLVLQYYLIQYFSSLVGCEEIYTRSHNVNELLKSTFPSSR